MKGFKTIFATAALLGVSASALRANVVVPVPVGLGMPVVIPHAAVQLPHVALPGASLSSINADIPLPVPAIPGVPMYRLPSIQAPVAAALKPVAAVKAVPAVPAVLRAPVKSRLSAAKLNAAFDGQSSDVEEDEEPVIIEMPARPQTLPEDDLLRELGIGF